MGATVRLKSAADGFEFPAYRACVTDARRGGLVIFHAIWGVTPHLRALADHYAEIGYETLVPNLFERLHPGFAERDWDDAVGERQMGFGDATRWGADVLDLVQATIDAIAPPVFALGFCFGGTTAWLAASRLTGLSAVACYYGGQIIDYVDEAPKIPTILHMGKADELIPPPVVETIREAHPDLPVFMYDAGHAFVAPSAHHPESARLAELRTLALFSRNSGVRAEA